MTSGCGTVRRGLEERLVGKEGFILGLIQLDTKKFFMKCRRIVEVLFPTCIRSVRYGFNKKVKIEEDKDGHVGYQIGIG